MSQATQVIRYTLKGNKEAVILEVPQGEAKQEFDAICQLQGVKKIWLLTLDGFVLQEYKPEPAIEELTIDELWTKIEIIERYIRFGGYGLTKGEWAKRGEVYRKRLGELLVANG